MSSSRDLVSDPGVTLLEGDVLDVELLRARVPTAATGSSTFRRMPTSATDSSTRARISSRTRSRTATVLEAMRAVGVSKIAFSSTGSVYGEPDVVPTPEDAPFPIQTSLYAASKLAGEGMIGAYAHGFGFTGLIFRFVSILGERYTHGHVYDFYCALKARPDAAARAGRWATGEVLSLMSMTASQAMIAAARRTTTDPATLPSTTWAPTRRSSSTSRLPRSASTWASTRARRTPAASGAGPETAR